MIASREILTRMQSQATGCVAVLLVDLRDGTVIESCGDDPATNPGTVANVMRELAAPRHAILPGAGEPQEVILLADDCTYVCGRLPEPPHHAVAAICRGTQNLGLILAQLHHEIGAGA